ncbi:DUF3923 family protein [Staphylococcus auricularis]|uniref:DUF3923 family protein n=1 Tax=Staphylococcus auricularis TaxID=29379 RepID=UPI003EBCA557
MKFSWIFWWILNAFRLILFSAGTIFVWTRSVDGGGVTQTFDAKLISFIVLLVAFIFPLIVQIIWMIVNIVISKTEKKQLRTKVQS